MVARISGVGITENNPCKSVLGNEEFNIASDYVAVIFAAHQIPSLKGWTGTYFDRKSSQQDRTPDTIYCTGAQKTVCELTQQCKHGTSSDVGI